MLFLLFLIRLQLPLYSRPPATMGTFLSCLTSDRRCPPPKRRPAPPPPTATSGGSGNKGRSSMRDTKLDGVLTHEEALAAARLLLQDATGPFDRSASLRHLPPEGRKRQQQQGLPRSSSSRARSALDPPLQPFQLVTQDLKVDELETKHFVLVHGGGFGAWCWYKAIVFLEESGFDVNAIELTGSGVHSFNTNDVKSLSEYAKPLCEFLEKLEDGTKVILVGHDIGGSCISYAMEAFPSKIAKAVFVSAAMLTNGQSILDMLTLQAGTDDLMRQAQVFIYANGNGLAPTAIDLDKKALKDLFFNQSPAKDIALASVSMRSIPFAPVVEKLSLSEKNYGSIKRYYIETTEDNAIPLTLQQSMCNLNPPERVFLLKGSDHAPFFSKPQALHRHLVEIAKVKTTKQSHAAYVDNVTAS